MQLIVPAGTGGGADQMARMFAQVVAKHRLAKQPINVVNITGNSGTDAFLAMKAARGNPLKLVITLSNLFTAPLAAGAAFTWRDLTPVQMLALDQFVLWVPSASPYRDAPALLAAIRAAPKGSLKLGGTGTLQEDQLIGVLLETAGESRLTYLPYRGGGDVAKALAAGEVDMTVNNPIEAEALWREGKVRPLCVFDGARIEHGHRVTADRGWSDLPTCLSAGIPVQYLMMRGLFMAPGTSPAALAYYRDLIERVRATEEWKELMLRGAFKPSALAGAEFAAWLEREASFHKLIMREAKMLPGSGGTTNTTTITPASAASAPAARKP